MDPHGGAVRLTVADDGPGVPPGEEELVFERFRAALPRMSRAPGWAFRSCGPWPSAGAARQRFATGARRRLRRGALPCRGGPTSDLDPQLDDALPAGRLASGHEVRQTLRNGALAVAGLAVAVGVGMAANAVSQDSIGLSAQKLEPSRSLAPAEARRPVRGRAAPPSPAAARRRCGSSPRRHWCHADRRGAPER